jgi:uncharacterized protein YbjT (DUF2867 family)
MMDMDPPVLVTGATGYVGGRLIPRLLAAGYRVRAMGRSLEKMAQRKWACHPGVELVRGDVQRREDLVNAANGCRAAYYLVHAMIAHKGLFAEADRRGAENMKAAAGQCGLEQIIYLSGLGEEQHPNLSHHLASRHEVGRILRSGPVPVTILRAAMILGSGSASFEILRYLVERLPVMITPKWVRTPTQPIAIANALDYLAQCLNNPATYGRTFDIGGPDVLDYGELIAIYAREARLPKRRLFPVPLLSPTLSARWIHLVTPVPAVIAQPLTEGLSVPTVCRDNRIETIIPVEKISCRQAIRTALDRILQKQVETCWSDAGALQPPEWAMCGDAAYAGGTILNCAYRTRLDVPPQQVWQQIAGIGGPNGYYFGDWLWRLRGGLDTLAGGVGLRRGRRHPSEIVTGDALDFWRVLTVLPGRRLTLIAEMKMPGEALLDFRVIARQGSRSELQMISRFLPKGLFGIVYWYALYPFHVLIFKGMLKAIARKAGAAAAIRTHTLQLIPPVRCGLEKE